MKIKEGGFIVNLTKTSYRMVAASLFLLSACGEADEEKQTGESSLEPIEVEIDMAESAEVEKEIEIGAKVTQADEPVEDADEVLFEIWKEGAKESSEEILAEENENGVYSISESFADEAVFNVTAHVTARDMHQMPTEQITIGNPDDEDNQEEHVGHADTSSISAELQSKAEITAGEENDLSFQISNNGEPLTNARVRYEIWKTGEDTRTWEETEEETDSVYTGSHTFDSTGEYKVIVHVENDEDLHEHVEKTMSVEE
ncbi:hypothetical protein D7Z54_03660 [Salibacterium salarium]|uniref:YtkA-like domain-containing protein n=1 Tax=Salibacterium salarium TaxID=284579 RepID=A0A3R9PNU1_9BACI|nr:hypothetical protein D7Z54_03660 [Salibacterium salarium]